MIILGIFHTTSNNKNMETNENELGKKELTGTGIHSAIFPNYRCSLASTSKCLQNFLCSRLCPSTRPTCVGASSVLPFIPLTINCGVLSENLADFNNGNETENVVRSKNF